MLIYGLLPAGARRFGLKPAAPRVVEPVKPEAKQGILQTIRGKVSRAVDRVLGWLGVSSKMSSLKELANGGGQNTYYGNFQPKESQSTAAKEEKKELALVAAQNQMAQAVGQEANQISASIHNSLKSAQASGRRSVSNRIGQVKPVTEQHDDKALNQQRDQQTTAAKDNIVPSNTPARESIQPNNLKLGYTGDNKLDYASNLSEEQKQTLKKTVQEKTKSKIPLSPEEYKNWLNETLPLAHKLADLQNTRQDAKGNQTLFNSISEQMKIIGQSINDFNNEVIITKIPEHIIANRNNITKSLSQGNSHKQKQRHVSNIENNLLWINAISGAQHATRKTKANPNSDAIFNIHSYLERAQNVNEYGGVFCEYDTTSNSGRHDGDIIFVIPDDDFDKSDINAHQLTKIVAIIRDGKTMIKTVQKITLSDYYSCLPNPKKQYLGK